jgi:hypothetical protein
MKPPDDRFVCSQEGFFGREEGIYRFSLLSGGWRENSGRLRLRRKSAPPMQRVPLSSNQQTGIVPIKAKEAGVLNKERGLAHRGRAVGKKCDGAQVQGNGILVFRRYRERQKENPATRFVRGPAKKSNKCKEGKKIGRDAYFRLSRFLG